MSSYFFSSFVCHSDCSLKALVTALLNFGKSIDKFAPPSALSNLIELKMRSYLFVATPKSDPDAFSGENNGAAGDNGHGGPARCICWSMRGVTGLVNRLLDVAAGGLEDGFDVERSLLTIAPVPGCPGSDCGRVASAGDLLGGLGLSIALNC